MNTLEQFGWNIHFQKYTDNYPVKSLLIGRVVSIQGFKYLLITLQGEIEAELSGKLLYSCHNDELPKVGDWVFSTAYDQMGYIIDVFPRINEVYRKVAGKRTDRQVLAANVDYALIVQGLDQDFNVMRLDRYIVQMINCGVEPVVILNKSDLTDNYQVFMEEVSKLGRNCRVYFCSTYSGFGMEALKSEVFKTGKTYILIGSSGVGKSSLLKWFMPELQRSVQEISLFSGKGKHTTTTRDLFQLQNGSLVIDTPGMREFGLASDTEHVKANLFPAIDELAVECHYTDCRHLNEDGCAVLDGVKKGIISAEAYESYLKLVKEQRRFELRAEDHKRLGKQFGKMIREAKDYRKKYKF